MWVRDVLQRAVVVWIVATMGINLGALAAWSQEDGELEALFPPLPSERHHSDPEQESESGYSLSTLLRRVWIEKPLVRQQRTVVPLRLAGADPLPQSWLTASEALNRGLLRVAEQGGVGRLRVENRSSKYHIFIPAGQVFDGGKQNRSLADELALAPKQRCSIPVFCVEAGRWSGSHSFRRGQFLAPPSLRWTILSGQGQQAVWSHVSQLHRALAVRSNTGNLLSAYRHPRLRRARNSFSREIRSRLPKRTIGVVLLHQGRFVAAEVFGSEELARLGLPQVLDAFYVESVVQHQQSGRRWKSRSDASPSPDRLTRQLLDLVANSTWRRSRRSGAGEVWTFETGRILGRGLTFQDRPVHLVVLPKRGSAEPSGLFSFPHSPGQRMRPPEQSPGFLELFLR